jgi:hypothetical protein
MLPIARQECQENEGDTAKQGKRAWYTRRSRGDGVALGLPHRREFIENM